MMLTIFVVCIWIALPCECYKCPPPALKTRHASKFCPNDLSLYHCLWNTLIDDYWDVCLRPEASYTPGSYVVYSNALNARRCPTDRYQPFAYSTNDLNECIYEKSNCTEEGQILSEGGTYTTDATCKCDYTKGYSYLISPADPCQCKPSVEDCSCYLTPCLNKTHKLSPDYICEQINEDKIRQYQCPRVKHRQDNGDHEDRYNSTRDDYKHNVIRKPVDTVLAAGIITALVVLFLLVFTVFFGAVFFFLDSESDSPLQDFGLPLKAFVSPLQALIDGSNQLCDKLAQEVIAKDTNTLKHTKTLMKTNHIIILKGRQGTGKTTLALQLASDYRNKNYKLIILKRTDRKTLADIQRSPRKFVVILEDWFDIHVKDTEDIYSDMLDSHKFRKELQLIISSHLDESQFEKLRARGIITGNNVVDLDEESQQNTEDKQSILRCVLERYNKEMSDEEIEEAAAANTYYGFPRHCILFCEESKNFELGSKFFRQPPRVLIDIINKLKSSKEKQDKAMYCILVYIMLNPEKGLQSNVLDMANIISIFKEVYKPFFWQKSLSETDVNDACRELCSKDLLTGNNVYFLSSVVYQAVMLSYADVDLEQIIGKCDFMQILDIVRPLTYEMMEGERVLYIQGKKAKSASDIFAQRMASVCIDDEKVIRRVVRYIRKCKFEHLLEKVIKYLENKMKTLITDKRIQNVMTLMSSDMTSSYGLELLDYTPTTFVLTWTLVALQKSGENDLMEDLIERYIRRSTTITAVEILRTIVDQHNNSFLHYCVLWWYNKDNPFIKYLENQFKKCFEAWVKYTDKNFEIINNEQMSAVDFAASFGNHELLKIFLELIIKTASKKPLPLGKEEKVRGKEIDRLLQYTETGKINNSIQSYSSSRFLNMSICGLIDVNDTFDYDKATAVLNSFKQESR